MKKILVIGIISIFILSGLSVTSATGWNHDNESKFDCDCTADANIDCCSQIDLPPDFVSMIVESGTDSHWNILLSNVPEGYDVTNGEYLGWCIQRGVAIDTGVLLLAKLYCSYDYCKPEIWQDDDWDKVNYIINNKKGEAIDVQEAIWFFIGDRPTLRPNAIEMIKEANVRGEGFCPGPGESIAVILDCGRDINPVVQGIIIEVTVPLEHLLQSLFLESLFLLLGWMPIFI